MITELFGDDYMPEEKYADAEIIIMSNLKANEIKELLKTFHKTI